MGSSSSSSSSSNPSPDPIVPATDLNFEVKPETGSPTLNKENSATRNTTDPPTLTKEKPTPTTTNPPTLTKEKPTPTTEKSPIEAIKRKCKTLQESQMKVLCDPGSMYQAYFEALLPKKRPENNFLQKLNWCNDSSNLEEIEAKFKEYRDDCKFLTVKLVLSGLKSDPNPIIKAVAKKTTEYGAVHASLQIGPWLIDWNKSEIAQPRPFKTTKPLCILDLKSSLPIVEETLQKICKAITLWNVEIEYTNMTHSWQDAIKSKKGSCHAFVDYLLNQLEVRKWWEKGGLIATFLKEIKEDSHGMLKPKYDGVTFESHYDLDNYYASHWSHKRPENEEVYELFRSFDRAFYLSGDRQMECPLMSSQVLDPDTWENAAGKDSNNPLAVLRGGSYPFDTFSD